MENDKLYIGIDNGVTGSIGWVNLKNTINGYTKTPTINSLNYQKKAKNINRIDVRALRKCLLSALEYVYPCPCIALIERPMVNPARFQASASALRALEATLIALEMHKIPYQYIDSKEWQKAMLPSGIKGAAQLKKASLDVGMRLFLNHAAKFRGDADGLLIAEYARRTKL